MIVDFVQRQREGVTRWRPAREVVELAGLDVAELGRDEARAFVESHHYERSFPAGRFRYGLHERSGELVGVAVFSQPVNDRSTACLPGEPLERVELGRFVLLDRVGANAETWFLGRCFAELRREGLSGVVSFSDPVARVTSSGAVVMPGHVGIIYQAHNAHYFGRSKAERRRMLPDGTLAHNRGLAKIRNRERGWQSGVDRLVSFGARPPSSGEDLRAWLTVELARVARSVPHGGNHKYAWTLKKRDRRYLGRSLPYPKQKDGFAC